MTKIVATDYKGKYFTLCDEDMLDEMDVVDNTRDINLIINVDYHFKNHIANCNYYGIPAYIGKDERLNKIIKEY